MQLSNEWFASVDDTDKGAVVVRGRLHLDTVRLSGCYDMRVEVQWAVVGDDKGMPTDTESEVIDGVMHIMNEALERSEVAVLTAIHTGTRQVRYIYYATSIDAFASCIKPLLQRMGELPLRMGATLDPEWIEYTAMIARRISLS